MKGGMRMFINPDDLLFDDQLAPITSSMGFLEASIARAAEEFHDWMKEIKIPRGINIRVTETGGTLEETLSALLPLRVGEDNRSLLIPTQSEWTCYLDNNHRGTDPSPIRYLARRLGCRTVWVVAVPNTLKKVSNRWQGRQGALVFEVFGPEQTEWLNVIRAIRVVNDAGRWEFNASGDPLPFEDTQPYKAKRKKDRFTFELMKRYLNELGIRAFDGGYYLPANKPSAVLVELHGNLPTEARDVSLEEARRLNHIED